jgi:hypothetical protein
LFSEGMTNDVGFTYSASNTTGRLSIGIEQDK